MEDSKRFMVRFCGTTQLDGDNTGLQLPMKRDDVSLTSASSEVDEVREEVVKKLASLKAIQELKQVGNPDFDLHEVMCEMVSLDPYCKLKPQSYGSQNLKGKHVLAMLTETLRKIKVEEACILWECCAGDRMSDELFALLKKFPIQNSLGQLVECSGVWRRLTTFPATVLRSSVLRYVVSGREKRNSQVLVECLQWLLEQRMTCLSFCTTMELM